MVYGWLGGWVLAMAGWLEAGVLFMLSSRACVPRLAGEPGSHEQPCSYCAFRMKLFLFAGSVWPAFGGGRPTAETRWNAEEWGK